jgi:hypothetical protein
MPPTDLLAEVGVLAKSSRLSGDYVNRREELLVVTAALQLKTILDLYVEFRLSVC